jgi:2-polyprenyl-3-methyl-5-hydroxy-6-metoxy-1,4-benzoquinol methylase
MNRVYQWARKRAIQQKLEWINSFGIKNRQLLDYGCGTGEFLAAAKHNGWQVEGLEPDESARAQAIENHQLMVSAPEKLNELNSNKFGLISLWHVLEHVHALRSTVAHFHRCLSDGGIVVIAVPNHTAYDATKYKEFWAAYDVPRHLYHFSIDSVSNLMEKEGFEIMSIRPLFFDPFYITLLSDKYKNGKSNYINAVFVGIMTTIKGKLDIRANSSLLYVIRKKTNRF